MEHLVKEVKKQSAGCQFSVESKQYNYIGTQVKNNEVLRFVAQNNIKACKWEQWITYTTLYH